MSIVAEINIIISYLLQEISHRQGRSSKIHLSEKCMGVLT